ncbi:hypothetical protein P7D22_15055 [Lichenihabitans sp. Uapishka_5]|uniref:hypothetical protein n=1 Tax=Lichenihabitans sp. Uapishka_5 TaxID=3037302 RepID=UPI0029E7FFD6|nr:hypothetical protein [Lichenihabitans sp. Uapishka_5]MDX7952486.1 hypothetical protein [Lichenihabitans sp. Uapishka_5]
MTNTKMVTWHFFRRTAEADLWCAVPAHQALPGFLMSGDWHYTAHRLDHGATPPGFDSRAAAVAERFNGFYLFQLVAEPRGLTLAAA